MLCFSLYQIHGTDIPKFILFFIKGFSYRVFLAGSSWWWNPIGYVESRSHWRLLSSLRLSHQNVGWKGPVSPQPQGTTFQFQMLTKRTCFLSFLQSVSWTRKYKYLEHQTKHQLGGLGWAFCQALGEDLALKHSCLSQCVCSGRALGQGALNNNSQSSHFRCYSYVLRGER